MMDPNREEVDKTLSLIESLDLPHPSGALLSSFVREALHPVLAARYVNDRLLVGDACSLVSDWIYIVDSGEPKSLSSTARISQTSWLMSPSNHRRPPPVATKYQDPARNHQPRREQVLYHRQGWHCPGSFARRADSSHSDWLGGR
jgi:hypothetical protein